MAQALYGEHPLDDYLRGQSFPMEMYRTLPKLLLFILKESGDLPDHVPGAYADSSDDEQEVEDIIVDSDSQWKRSSVATAAEVRLRSFHVCWP